MISTFMNTINNFLLMALRLVWEIYTCDRGVGRRGKLYVPCCVVFLAGKGGGGRGFSLTYVTVIGSFCGLSFTPSDPRTFEFIGKLSCYFRTG